MQITIEIIKRVVEAELDDALSNSNGGAPSTGKQNALDEEKRLAWAEIEAALSAAEPSVAVNEPAAWLHPTAGWSHADRKIVAQHCLKSGPGPIPLYATLSAQVQDVAEERYRHKKRGSIYTVTARGRLQVDGDLDNEKVIVYRGEDGQTWVRPEYEFNDGRFEPLVTAPAKQEGKQ